MKYFFVSLVLLIECSCVIAQPKLGIDLNIDFIDTFRVDQNLVRVIVLTEQSDQCLHLQIIKPLKRKLLSTKRICEFHIEGYRNAYNASKDFDYIGYDSFSAKKNQIIFHAELYISRGDSLKATCTIPVSGLIIGKNSCVGQKLE